MDDEWTFLAGSENHLSGVLRAWPDGITFHGVGITVRGFAVHDGAAPIRGADSLESHWREKARWLVYATPEWWQGPESINVHATDGTDRDIAADLSDPDDFRRAQAIRFSADSPADQVRALGYRTIARNDDGYFEVLADPDHPGLPMVASAAGGEYCYLIGSGSDLWVWDHSPTTPADAPGPDWRIPGGPVTKFHGTVAELRLFHTSPSPAEQPGHTGDRGHHWAHPFPHFHLGPSDPAVWPMVAPERSCRYADRRNRDWHGAVRHWVTAARDYAGDPSSCDQCLFPHHGYPPPDRDF
ncbi:MAG TPA: hypothetical protein VN408_42625 [Actinoplanes sp.]|nr:hypothetical protein [Actinoplanes sp.]